MDKQEPVPGLTHMTHKAGGQWYVGSFQKDVQSVGPETGVYLVGSEGITDTGPEVSVLTQWQVPRNDS